MNTNTNKPTTLIIDDLKRELITQINNSDLPIFIIEPIIKDIYCEIKEVLRAQTEQDRIVYENSLDANKDNENDTCMNENTNTSNE